MPQSFRAAASGLSAAGFADCATVLKVNAPELWSVLTVETRGCGFLPDRRPAILFERHIFHKLTNSQFDQKAPDLSSATAGGYSGGAREYDRLARAIDLDANAAMQSASWGIGQVMGMNFKSAGFGDVASMVAAFCESEDKQLLGVANFMTANNLDASLRVHDWPSFARGYNGPDYAKNKYDSLLAGAFLKYSQGPLPDLDSRRGQLLLTYLGYAPGAIDGVAGKHTTSAMNAFQSKESLPLTQSFDTKTMLLLATRVAALPN
ncbi:MAG TPA: N-acetylmuramidase domain-containing protein [Dongiaceae bacterium]|nr:N-acetylmuramidase domain-containing protein [Dongiaceae bacterium]